MATTYQVSIVASSQVDQVDVIANTQVYQVTVVADILSGGGGVQSVTGDGVGGTATNVVMTFPTTGQITETANDRFVTDSQLVVINNTSGINTGDQDISGIATNASDITALENEQITQNDAIALNTAKRSYPLADENRLANTSGVNTGDQDISGIATNASDITALENEQITQNNAIALNTAKRSYPLADENRLANTSGTNTGDQDLSPYLTIATASTTYEPIRVANQNYVTDAELVVIGNTSGTNTGDQNLSEFTTSERENNTVLFDQNYIIGNTAARTGNILFDFTDAKLGATTFLIHNNTGAYSFPVQGVIYDFDPASLTSIAGNIIFAFTITDITLGSEIVQIRLTLTEDQQIVQVSQPLKVVQITGVEVLSTAFTLVSGLYEADITNANILIDSSVEVIPENSTISIVEAAVFLPQTISVTGSVKIFAKNEPSGSIFVTLNIFKTQ